jgi:hypothetical protein
MKQMLSLNELQQNIVARIRRQDKVISARCGWGSGKTSGLVFALWFISRIRPGTSSLLITDTSPRYRSVLGPELEKWLGPIGWTFNALESKWTDSITGSSIWCRSYFRPGTREATHNPLEGLNITSGVALIDECQTFKDDEVAQKALGRLRSGPSPILILVGLPVADAWWCSLAEKAGYDPLLFTSYVNQDNLSDEWFEATKLLPEEERQAMVMNKPRPPSGLIYNEWTESHVIDDFKYDPSMTGRIAIDWGFRKPSVLIMVYDEEREATIIVHEINPQEVTISELAQMILRVAYPRSMKDQAPGPRIWLDSGVADKAGAARNDQTGRSAFREMKKHPDQGGIGLPLRFTTDPILTNVLNGIQKVKRAFSRRKYLCTREVWMRGERAIGNSFRKAILSYGWTATKDEPKKDGREDPLDALRYDCIIHHWSDLNVPSYTPRKSNSDNSLKRRHKRFRSF